MSDVTFMFLLLTQMKPECFQIDPSETVRIQKNGGSDQTVKPRYRAPGAGCQSWLFTSFFGSKLIKPKVAQNHLSHLWGGGVKEWCVLIGFCLGHFPSANIKGLGFATCTASFGEMSEMFWLHCWELSCPSFMCSQWSELSGVKFVWFVLRSDNTGKDQHQ